MVHIPMHMVNGILTALMRSNGRCIDEILLGYDMHVIILPGWEKNSFSSNSVIFLHEKTSANKKFPK